METGYKRKIKSLVDKMVDGKEEFNKKTFYQQETIKEEMVENISKAISVLNDLGQKLVLKDMEAQVDDPSMNVLDSNGNVDISRLLKITQNIVNIKIEEARSKGIDLTENRRFSEENKESTIDVTLTAVAVNEMLKNHRSLSMEDRIKLAKMYPSLTVEQRTILTKQIEKETRENIENLNSPLYKSVASALGEGQKISMRLSNLAIVLEKVKEKIPLNDEEKRLLTIYASKVIDKDGNVDQTAAITILDLIKENLGEDYANIMVAAESFAAEVLPTLNELENKTFEEMSDEEKKQIREKLKKFPSLLGIVSKTTSENITEIIEDICNLQQYIEMLSNPEYSLDEEDRKRLEQLKEKYPALAEELIKNRTLKDLLANLAGKEYKNIRSNQAINSKLIQQMQTFADKPFKEMSDEENKQIREQLKGLPSLLEIVPEITPENATEIIEDIISLQQYIEMESNPEYSFEEEDRKKLERLREKYPTVAEELKRIKECGRDAIRAINPIDRNEKLQIQNIDVTPELVQYIEILKSLDEEDLLELEELDEEGFIEAMTEMLEENGINPDIIETVQDMLGNEKTRSVLSDSQKREAFFAQMDQIIAGPTIETTEPTQIPIAEQAKIPEGDVKTYVEEHSEFMNISAIEEYRNKIDVKNVSYKDVVRKPIQETVGKSSIEPKTEQLYGKEPIKGQAVSQLDGVGEFNLENLGSDTDFSSSSSSEDSTKKEAPKEKTEIAVQDNSFIGKVRRVIANMRQEDPENKKGFFGRLRDSIRSVFSNRSNDYNADEERSSVDDEQKPSEAMKPEPDAFTQNLTKDVTQPVIPRNETPNVAKVDRVKDDDQELGQ